MKTAEEDAYRAANAPKKVVFCPPIATFKVKDSAADADIRQGLALSVECDAHPKIAREKLELLLGPATVVVASGGIWTDPATGEPHAKLHLHWRLTVPAEGPRLALLKEARRFATRIAGADLSNVPPCHPIRWPGSWHRKGDPVLCAIDTLWVDNEINLDAALVALQAAAPPEQARQQGNGAAGESSDWSDLLANIVAGRELHDSITKLAAKMIVGGVPDAIAVNLIRGALENSSAPRNDRFADRMAEVPRDVRTAREKYATPQPAPAPQSAPDATANAAPGGAPTRFKLISFEDIRIDTRPTYLVKGIIPRGGMIIIWGQPKCGKSFLAYDLAMHVALGRAWRNRRTRQGTVIYLALEGGSGFANRVEAWRRKYLGEYSNPVPFYLVSESIDIIKEHDALIAAIKAQAANPPALVVIDTLNRGMVGDENKSDDMAKFVRAADAIRTAFDCAVIVVHHCGVAGSRPRGHTSLSGADDAQIAVSRDDDGILTVAIEHLKDGEASTPLGGRLERVELGRDDDGETFSSCVLVPAEAATKERKLSPAPQLALDQLNDLLADSGAIPPANEHIPAHLKACDVNVWRECFYKAHPATKPEAKQKAFVRACLTLQEKKIIGLWGEFVWLAK
jgi:hypothetical protein